MPSISVLIKPASSNCNLKCSYCFYNSISEKRTIKNYGIMEIDTIESIVKKVFEFADYSCTFAFQGGEPTLAGIDFFEQLMNFQKRYNTKNIKVYNSIQTNGIAIDEKWAKFFSRNNFLVGISLDGYKKVHDVNRIETGGKGSFSRVIKAISILNDFKVNYNILFVVNASTARHANKIYKYFKESCFEYIQFIPCIDPFDEEPGKQPHSLTPKRYAEFLTTFFDLWYRDMIAGNGISVRTFDNFVTMLMGYAPEACDMSGICTCQFVIEADGSVYPCDFYVLDKWRLGNILTDSIQELGTSHTTFKFIEESTYLSPECRECKWLTLCRGGCRRMRESFGGNKPSLNYFCLAYKEFFNYSITRIQEISYLYNKYNM